MAAAVRRGAGAWIRYGGSLADGELDFAAEHYRVAILQPWETEAAARLKDRREDMVVLAYRCLSSVRDFEPAERRASGLGAPEARRHGWMARRASGGEIEWSTYPGHYQMRVWDDAYRRAWVERVLEATADTAFDGIMADNDVFDDYYGLDLAHLDPGDAAAPGDTAGLRRALGMLVDDAGRALASAGLLLVPNIAEARREPGRWERHAAWGGGFDECWLGWGDDRLFDEEDALAQAPQLDGPGLGVMRTPSGGSGPAFDGSPSGLYGLAAFWVLGGGPDHRQRPGRHARPARASAGAVPLPPGAPLRAYAATGADDYSRTPWFPALDADLGAPVGGAVFNEDEGVWRRDFEGGVAAVVLDARRGGIVGLPAGLRAPGPAGDPDGEPLGREVELGPHRGLIALRP